MERLAALYALGYDATVIHEVLETEFGDYELHPITVEVISKVIRHNRTELVKMREQLTVDCRAEIAKQFAKFFEITKSTESKMVDVYLKKMDSLLDELTDLDIQETDEFGNKTNTQRFFLLISAVDKLHGMIAKITGTNALRDVEIHRLKKMAEKEVEETPMTPGGRSGPGVIEAEVIPTTKFTE